MKKYLMSGVAAIAFLAAFTSCSKSTDLYDEGAVQQREEQKKQETIANNIDQAKVQYAAAFEKAFGKVGANVDWGFSSKAATRAAQPNSNQWGTHDDNDKYLDWPKPADITDAERAAVLAVFNQKGKESYTDLLNLTDFFVQQVYCGPNGEKMNQLACWDPQGHEVTENPEWNGWKPYTYTSNDDEVNNFNAGKYSGNALQGCMLMWNSSTSQWSFKTSQSGGERIYDHWRMEYIPGYGYYVGLDHEAWRQAPANANEEDKRDYIYNDWIIKIVPGKGFTYPVSYPRVIAEDLNAEQASDFDFNDVVFDVVKAENNKTTLRLIACGGIYKLTVAGVEVHEKFGQKATNGLYPMINTGANADINGLDPVEFDIDGTYNTPELINNIEIRVWKPGTGEDGIPLTAEKGKAACKILVDDSFGVVPEKQGIGDKCGLFSSYVQGGWDPIVEGKWWLK